MNKSPAFQLYANDFFVDTITWELEELGLYVRLLFVEWSNGPLPNDRQRLAKVAGTSLKLFNKLFELVSTKFVLNDDGKLINIRLEQTREKQKSYIEKQRLKGLKSAEKRATVAPTAVATTVQPRLQPEGNSSSSSSTTKNIYKENSLKILSYLNEKTGKKYSDASQIEARLRNGGSLEGCMKIIDNKLKDPFFIENLKYMNPLTLFRKSHWDKYLNDEPEVKKSSW